MHSHGRDEILGTAYSDHDLVVFLQNAGIDDPDPVMDDDHWVEWRGARPHQWNAA
ncbi:hypothetical protein [Streptomyces sp. NPDC059378]|uniref:hypothetical protein n=1 Tax=Streptomyces sp. NPDC059378 TaxID=3346815 RepID=UPI0036B44E7C